MYTHTVQYYETDRMGITHHSNYVRWMEEARIDFLEQQGWSYAKLEEAGIFSPVLSVSCHYLKSSTFSDKIQIHVYVESFTGVRLTLKYEMRNADDVLICTASSEHCFIDADGFPIRLKRKHPDFYNVLEQLANKTDS